MTTRKRSAPKKPKKKSKFEYRLRLSKDTDNFWDFNPNIQSLYWILISVGVIGTAVINFNMSNQISELLLEINEQQAITSTLDVKSEKILKE